MATIGHHTLPSHAYTSGEGWVTGKSPSKKSLIPRIYAYQLPYLCNVLTDVEAL